MVTIIHSQQPPPYYPYDTWLWQPTTPPLEQQDVEQKKQPEPKKEGDHATAR